MFGGKPTVLTFELIPDVWNTRQQRQVYDMLEAGYPASVNQGCALLQHGNVRKHTVIGMKGNT